MLVIQHQLAEQLDLLDLIVRRSSQTLERLRLDAVYLGFDLRNLRQCRSRQRCAGLFRAHDSGSGPDEEGGPRDGKDQSCDPSPAVNEAGHELRWHQLCWSACEQSALFAKIMPRV